MNRRLSLLIAASAALITSCTSAAVQETRTPKAQRELAAELAGRTPGAPVRCLANYRTDQIQIIDQWTILYRDGRTVYVQNPQGGCRGLGMGYTLVTRPLGVNQTCEGDLNRLVDLRTGSFGGTCIFGPFIPYTKAS